MDNKENKEALIKKIKAALIKSGFPLELNVSKILKNNDWKYSANSYYNDFETNTYREYDIRASKNINGIDITLFIECKKSDEKQLILYSPQERKSPYFLELFLKAFPKLETDKEGIIASKKLKDALSELPLFNLEYKLAKGIIFSRGDKIEQDNSNFFKSINGLVKQSIVGGYDGFIETNFRILFFYIVIYDGFVFELTSSKENDFLLNEIDYGQYSLECHFDVPAFENKYNTNFYNHTLKYGEKFLIEIIKPSSFDTYLKKIDVILNNIDKSKILNWGIEWPKLKK